MNFYRGKFLFVSSLTFMFKSEMLSYIKPLSSPDMHEEFMKTFKSPLSSKVPSFSLLLPRPSETILKDHSWAFWRLFHSLSFQFWPQCLPVRATLFHQQVLLSNLWLLSTKLEIHYLPGGGAQFPLRTVWAMMHKERLPSKEYSMERERRKSFCTVEKRDKHYLKSGD